MRLRAPHRNKDVDDAVKRHINWTKTLPTGDPLKFDRSTPKRQTASYLRLFPGFVQPDGTILELGPEEGALSSVRLIPLDRCMGKHLWGICDAGGAVVLGLGSRNGWRAERAREAVGLSKNWGGHREKGDAPDECWCHPDAVGARAADITRSVVRAVARKAAATARR